MRLQNRLPVFRAQQSEIIRACTIECEQTICRDLIGLNQKISQVIDIKGATT
jgi:hypothetical protein